MRLLMSLRTLSIATFEGTVSLVLVAGGAAVVLQCFNGRVDLLVGGSLDGAFSGYGDLGEVLVDQILIGLNLSRNGRVGAVEASAFGR